MQVNKTLKSAVFITLFKLTNLSQNHRLFELVDIISFDSNMYLTGITIKVDTCSVWNS